jgi:CHASE2 domain-containing sensor protein
MLWHERRWTDRRPTLSSGAPWPWRSRPLFRSPPDARPRPPRFAGSPYLDRRRRLWTEWLATAVLSTALLTALVATGATTALDNDLYDAGLRLMRKPPRPDILIVALDQASLAGEGRWPWPRRLEAELIADINRDGPRALGCNFLFLFPTTRAEDQAIHDAIALAPTFLAAPSPQPDYVGPIHMLEPTAVIRSAAAGIGSGDSQIDADGVVRRAFLYQGGAPTPAPRMVLQMARRGDAGPGLDPAPFPDGERLIPFAGPPRTFANIPAIKVLEHGVPRGFFHDKFVLMGATAPELLDSYRTPMSATVSMPSVEVDANILNSLLDGRAIMQAPPFAVLATSTALLWIMLIALVRLRPRENLALAGAMTALPLAGAVGAIVTPGVWVPPASYMITVALLLPYWGWRRLNAASAYFAEELKALKDHAPGADPTREAARVGGDVVLQQMMLLEDTRRRISDLRRLVADILADFPDPVLVVDLGGHILTVNPAAGDFAAATGASVAPEAPIEPLLSKIVPFNADPRPFWPPPARSDETGSPASRQPLTGEGPDGRAYEVRFTPTRGADDAATGWIVHLADITRLVSAMRQREEALQLLSHDMRSPLSAILASLNHPDFQGAPAALRRRIEGQAARGLDLADAFVRLAKAESADYTFEPFDLVHIARDAVDAVWALARAGEVTVEFEPDEVEHVILADRGLMTRALVNLLDNAVKFSSPGQCVACRLAPGTLNGAPAVVCEIADRAGGISRAQLAVLFRRFASGRDAESGSAGVGLGLALVNAVITRHQGLITCDSVEGEGTVFSITLPLHDEGDATDGEPPPNSTGAEGHLSDPIISSVK